MSSPLTLTLHEDVIKTAKYRFYAVERCSVSSDRQEGTEYVRMVSICAED